MKKKNVQTFTILNVIKKKKKKLFDYSEQTAILLNEIRKNEINKEEGTHLQKLISRFTLNTICRKNLLI